ncbi:Proteasome subunit alpha type-2 [Thoreauomyces humboldtii]|nr:Proteasome subunit alpha type-2 [Thoreauomyces humboldtii]
MTRPSDEAPAAPARTISISMPSGAAPNALALKGVILVGGPSTGTRFRPLSLDCPKPLFPIAGRPMIHHHISALARLPGMREVLIVGSFENSVFDGFLTEAQAEFPDISVRYLREYQPLGTAGGLFHFRDQIVRGADLFFVLNADIACSFPLQAMLATHARHSGVATLLATRADKSIASRFGCLAVGEEGNSNEVLHFVEKPQSFLSELVSSGVYLFRTNVFDTLRDVVQARQDEASETSDPTSDQTRSGTGFVAERFHLEADVLGLLTARTKQLYAHVCIPGKDFWLQLKTGSSVIPANRLYLQHFLKAAPKRLSLAAPKPSMMELGYGETEDTKKPNAQILDSPMAASPTTPTTPDSRTQTTAYLIQPVYIHPTAVVHPSAKVGPNVSLGPRVHLGRGVRVRDAVLLDDVEVRSDSIVVNSVVSADCRVGCWARIEGAPDESPAGNATLKGYKVPSATLLGKGVTVANEVAVRNCVVMPAKDIRTSLHNEIVM